MKPQLTSMHVQYSICVCVISSLNKASMVKTVPSEMLELMTCRQAQALCATSQQLIFDYTVMIIIIMCSKKKSTLWSLYHKVDYVIGCFVILKYATLQQAVYPTQHSGPDHIDHSDVSTIKEFISFYFPVTVLVPKSPLLIVLSLVKLTKNQ